jgi:hypothetical protein
MMRSLYSGVSGLKNHQVRMDVIGNNISNVNTHGFKTERVTFQDMISQELSAAMEPKDNIGGVNPKQVGLGSLIAAIDKIMTQGSFQTTGKNTDVAISGEGTLSPSQKGYADARLDGRAEIRLQDYREVRGKFDNIVSIEMIEAVGERYWPSYFKTLRERLAEGGHAMVQSIVVNDSDFPTYRKQSDFIREHIFPGGMLPCVSVIQQEAARAGLRVNEVYSFGSHYAQTCRLWAERLTLQSARIMRFGYDNRFLRSWQFYLESCAATFAAGRTNVVQVDLVHAAG